MTLPRFSLLGLLLALLLGPVRAEQKRVCHSFRNAELVYVIKVLARDMGKNVFVGPTVEGSVTLEVAYLTPERALRIALASCDPSYDFRTVQGFMVVEEAGRLDEIVEALPHGRGCGPGPGAVRQEFVLEEARPEQVVEFLQGQYPQVKFVPHPVANGFYAVGSKKDILSIKSELPGLDHRDPPPPVMARMTVDTRAYGSAQELESALGVLAPEVRCRADGDLLELEGTPEALEMVRSWLNGRGL